LFNLIVKDLKLSGKMNLFGLFFPVFISFAGVKAAQLNLKFNILYILAIFMITYFSSMYSNGFDIKNNSDIALNSFPINRVDVVRGKYLVIFIYAALYSLSIIAITNIYVLMGLADGGRVANIWDVLAALILIVIFYSIYYPLYFKSENGLATVNQLIYILIILAPALIQKFGGILSQSFIFSRIMNLDIEKIAIVFLGFSVFVYFISLQVSKRIYLSKEF